VHGDGDEMSYTTKLWRQVATDKRGLGSAALIGALASLSAVALMGVSAWLISTASEMPPVLTLSVAAVSVRFFALARALLRYLERLLGHNAALEGLTNLRITVFQSLERITPIGLGRFSRGDFLARLGADVDGSLDLPLRVVLPWLQAALVSLATVTFVWWLLPSAGIALALTSLIAIVIAPILIRWFITRSDTALAQVRSQVTEAVVAIAENSTEINMSGIQRSALNSLNVRDERVNSELKNQADNEVKVDSELALMSTPDRSEAEYQALPNERQLDMNEIQKMEGLVKKLMIQNGSENCRVEIHVHWDESAKNHSTTES